MAQEILVTGVGELLKKVCFLAADEIGLAWGVEGALKKLRRSVSLIEVVLEDAERRQGDNAGIKLWLKSVKQVAYDADDVLDEFATERLRRKMELQNRLKSKVKNFFSLSNPIAFRFKIAHKIVNINRALDEIIKEKSLLSLVSVATGDATHAHIGDRNTSSHYTPSQFVGREADMSAILNHLTNSRDQEVLSVISIVGVGGLGKTTLVQKVYNDKSMDELFDFKMWVCVSQVFDVERILGEMIEFLDGTKCSLSNLEMIVRTLQKKISGKRFLLVLDDVWNEEPDKWERLKFLIGDGSQRSKIIVTTRSHKVASIVGSSVSHDLSKLSKKESWNLFKLRAFRGEEPDDTLDLVRIGRDIVKSCGGVPLALMHLGSLMQSKRTEREWQHIRDSEIWDLPENRKIMKILKLSFDNLPPPLKLCFSYCAMFPEDELIRKEMLVQMWMAEGFLEPPKGSSLLMEDIGNDYFKILMLNSFFQDIQKDEFESVQNFKMHDLVHDLARLVVGDECCFQGLERVEEVDKIRRLSSTSEVVTKLPKTNKLRMFMFVQIYSQKVEFNSGFSKLKYLRVLDLSGAGLTELHSSVSKLRHLRFLDVSRALIKELPNSLCSLYNLQTLGLGSCRKLTKLPKDMSKLISLRHVDISGCYNLSEMPRDIGQLKSLQTLSKFIVGKEGSGCSIRELECLNLGGELQIERVENVGNARDANLEQKSNIHSLELNWSESSSDTRDTSRDDDVLEGLRPHSNLKMLEISHFQGGSFATWMNSTFLPNLVEICLISCKRCEHLPALGQISCLKSLKIEGMEALRCIGNEFYGDDSSEVVEAFPSLKELVLQNMPNLEEWKEPPESCRSFFPLLEKLRVYRCGKLRKTPSWFPSLKELTVQMGSNGLIESLSCKLSSLTSLWIYDVEDMTSLPQGLLNVNGKTSLRDLVIKNCSKLVIEELKHLTSLEWLRLWNCKSVTSSCLSDLQLLTSLRDLEIGGFKEEMKFSLDWLHCLPLLETLRIGDFGEEMDEFPLEGIQHLASLPRLELYGWPKIKSLPQQIRYLTKLQHLRINNFQGLVELPDWLTELSSLQELHIWDCTNLKHLPQGMPCLTSLKRLVVHRCPLLEERYEREKGEEWHTISHIPSVVFLQ